MIERLVGAGLRDLPDGVLDTPKDPRWAAAVPAAPGRGQWHETATPPGLLFPTSVKVEGELNKQLPHHRMKPVALGSGFILPAKANSFVLVQAY